MREMKYTVALCLAAFFMTVLFVFAVGFAFGRVFILFVHWYLFFLSEWRIRTKVRFPLPTRAALAARWRWIVNG